MSDGANRDTIDTEQAGEHAAIQATGRREGKLDEQAAEQQAQEQRAEHEADVIEQDEEQPTDRDRLRGEIAEAREELGETVEALAAKVDIKSQTKEKVDEHKAQARAKLDEATQQVKQKPAPVVALAAGIVALVLLVARRRRRH